MNQDSHITLDKELHRDIDAIIQRLRSASERKPEAPFQRPSRERGLCLTKLQEAVIRELAQEAYGRYGAVTDFKNFQGNPIPKFEELPPKIQEAWEAAVAHPVGIGNPYPNSKDPSNTRIDPTADGLKL